MKVSFLYPNKIKNGEEVKTELTELSIKISDRFVYQTIVNQIPYMLVNCLKIKTVVLLGQLRGKYYWCNSIPFSWILEKCPALKKEEKRFYRNGFNKRLLEALFKVLKMNEQLKEINKIDFNHYIKEEYGK